MKYIIEFDDAPSMREEGLNYYKCIDAPWFSASDHIINKLTPYDPDEEYQRGFDDAHKISVEECRNKYEQGLNDAWDLADDVSHNRGNILDILGCPTFGVAFKQLTASEAIQKLKEYERKKKAEEEFQVGDEVENEDGETAYVLNPDYDGTLILSMEKYTCPQRQSKTKWKKTGFRNEIIAELLGLEDAR